MTLLLDDNQDWIEGVKYVPSPNCDARPVGSHIELIVIHGISLPPGKYGGCYIDDLFCNRLDPEVDPYFKEIKDLKVSSHLMVSRSGEITQYVPFSKRAWHAGISEFKTRANCNDFSIGIELEGCDDQPYEEVQYMSLVAIIKAIKNHWKNIGDGDIVGHSDIAPGRKTDPGPAFDWDYLFSLLNAS